MKDNSLRAKTWIALSLSAAAPWIALPQTNSYQKRNLVSDLNAVGDIVDPNLVNPWGMSFSATSPFWISNNGSGTATLFNGSGQPFPVASPITVNIPPAPGRTGLGMPTGQVFNSTTAFAVAPGMPAAFIFATEDGTISAWNPGVNAANAVIKVDNSAAGAVYNGLALASPASGPMLYAANLHAGTVDVFDANFNPVSIPGAFTDPNIPAGFAPFNIANLGGNLYVTYAMQDAAQQENVPGPGNGFVDVYDLNGNLLQSLISGAPLNSPWGMAIAPANFGAFSNALLVGNFGDGTINAFDPATGASLGTLQDKFGNPISIQGLWAIAFGNGANGSLTNALYFTAGIAAGGAFEGHGLFGNLQAADNLGVCAQ
jgi:uncharacterized protein (TIGR03118 family)